MIGGGIHLSLMIGPGVPIPVPEEVIEALESVQVTSSGQTSGFQLAFQVGKGSMLLETMLPAGYFDPLTTRVVIVATVNGQPSVLMDGIVTRQELAPSNDVGKTTFTVTGEDLSRLMDLVEMPFMRYPAMPIITRIYTILSKYMALGVVPLALPPFILDVDLPIEKIPSQTGTDLQYIRQLARGCGYVFYVEPGPAPGASIAYFGPDIRLPVPQPALNVNLDAQTNVESLSFSFDGTAKKITVMTVGDPVTRRIPVPIPVPDISILRPPMGARLPLPMSVVFPEDAMQLTVPEAVNYALGIGLSATDAVTANGSLDVMRYGQPLRSRMLVGVRGAGLAYDGLYYVNSVTHSLKRGEYKQNFSLSRDGLVSNTPVVAP